MKTDGSSQLVLHIGDPKTGTSSIQYALHSQLVDCPTQRIELWRQRNAIALANALKPAQAAHRDERYAEVRDWAQTSAADTLVISSEFYAQTDPVLLQQVLATYLPDHAATVRVIAYVRPHVSRSLAAFIQQTKTGQLFSSYTAFMEPGAGFRIAITPRFLSWRAQFGDRFTLRPFIREELRDQDTVADFCGLALGDAPFRLTQPVQENVALSTRALSGLKLVQRRLKACGVGPIARAFLGGALSNDYLPQGRVGGEKPALNQATAQALAARFEPDARAMDDAFFARPLMQEALAQSLRTANGPLIDLRPVRYFTPQNRNALKRMGEDLAGCFQKAPQVWSDHHSIRHGQMTPTPKQQQRFAKKADFLAQMDRRLGEIADILRG